MKSSLFNNTTDTIMLQVGRHPWGDKSTEFIRHRKLSPWNLCRSFGWAQRDTLRHIPTCANRTLGFPRWEDLPLSRHGGQTPGGALHRARWPNTSLGAAQLTDPAVAFQTAPLYALPIAQAHAQGAKRHLSPLLPPTSWAPPKEALGQARLPCQSFPGRLFLAVPVR